MNIPPNSGTTPRRTRRLNEAATAWLKTHDKQAQRKRKLAAKKAERDREQARENPALVATYRRLMLRR